MAYESSNLELRSALIGRGNSTAQPTYGGNKWFYKSTADGSTSVAATSYFSNGHLRGMRKYDTVEFLDVGSTLLTMMAVTAVSTGAGATVTSLLSTA
jgi:hypothetical protein